MADLTKASPPGRKLRLWEQLACSVRQQVDDGTLKPGDLVVIGRLLREHGLKTRETAGRALRLLEREGRLRQFPGYGYVVQHAHARPRQ
jgi:DNA-binding GntR family transcriptional regulator